MQTTVNFKKTIVGQQLITVAVTTIISLAVTVYFGVVNSFSIQSALTVLGLMFLLTIFVNLIRAPFQLDREQAEEIEELKTQNKQLKTTLDSINDRYKIGNVIPGSQYEMVLSKKKKADN